MPRAWVEVEWDGDDELSDEAGRAIVEGALDGMLSLLVDDPAVIEPSLSVTFDVPAPTEWMVAGVEPLGGLGMVDPLAM